MELKHLVTRCAEFAIAIRDGQQPRWLTILGASGTGKTHCARRLWDKLSGRFGWQGAEYIPAVTYWPAFISELRGGEAYGLCRDMQRWPILCLDDVGAERDTTGFASEQLNTLLGCRVGRWTILTSNLSLEQLAEIDPRIADRMIRQPNICLEVAAESYALRIRK